MDVEYITDEAGKVVNGYTYDAFGAIITSTEKLQNRYTYNGEAFDKTTEQYYLRKRFYNPKLSRFIQEDEYRGDGLNLYAFCANNPVMYVDPSGDYRRPNPIYPTDPEVAAVWRTVADKEQRMPIKADFPEWFDAVSADDMSTLYKDTEIRDAVKGKLRNGGGKHEWLMVSLAPQLKALGFTADDIMTAVTPTDEVRFIDIETPDGVLSGRHGTADAVVSSYAHKELENIIKGSTSKEDLCNKLSEWADTHVGREVDGELIKGREALPEELDTSSGKCGGKK